MGFAQDGEPKLIVILGLDVKLYEYLILLSTFESSIKSDC